MEKKARIEAAALFAKLGIDPQSSSEQLVERLSALQGRQDESDALIARLLGTLVVPAAASLLAKMEPGASGAARREIRRALFKLRQHGLAIRQLDREAPSRPEPRTGIGLSAMLSPIDSEGARVAWLVKDRAQGGVKRLWGLVSESNGLLQIVLTNLSRRDLRREREEFERRTAIRLTDTDWRLADFILCEAYRNTAEDRRSEVGQFLALRSELISFAPLADIDHPVYKEFIAAASAEPSLDLIKESEIASWRLPASQLKPFADEISEISHSPLVLNRARQEERIEAVVDRAIDALFSGMSGIRARRRLEDIAYYMARTRRTDAAQWAVSAASLMRTGADLKPHPFFRALAHAQLQTILSQEAERTNAEPRFIITPAEAMRARRPSNR